MKIKGEIKYLVLWIASDCNLKCKYCYALPNFSHKKMSFETAKRAIESCNTKKFTLILAGGEPIMNFSLIEKVYQYLKDEEYDCKIGLQTNGTLITKEIAEKLSKMNINIGISFDASFKINDFYRGETKKLIDAIEYFKENKKQINLNCVITDKSIKELEHFIEIAYYFENIDGIGLDLIRVGERAQKEGIQVASNSDIYNYLKKAYIRSKEIRKLVGREVKIREIEEIRYRKNNNCNVSSYCYSSLGQAMVISEKGDIYPCSSLVGNKEYYMGNIFDEKEIEIKKLSSGKKENCYKCKYNKFCKGYCPSRMIYNKEEAEDKDCILRKSIFKILEEEEIND